MQGGPPQSLEDTLAALAREAAPGERPSLPPLHLWNPQTCTTQGDFRIRADGVWMHEGAPITRPGLVRLFSTILRREEDGSFWLVTPGEKVAVAVEEAPFVAVRAMRTAPAPGEREAVVFVTNVGDVVAAGAAHPIRVVEDEEGRPRPYVHVRAGLEARILRPQFYDLVEWAVVDAGRLVVRSQGVDFDLGGA